MGNYKGLKFDVYFHSRAALIHPDNVSVRTLRGRSLLMCGQYEAALEDVSIVLIQLNEPFHPGALLVQAAALYAMGDFEHALVSYHRANSINNLLKREKEEILVTFCNIWLIREIVLFRKE